MKISKDYKMFEIVADEVFNHGTNWLINLDKLPVAEKRYHLKAFPEAILKDKVRCDYSKIKLEKYRDLFIMFLTSQLTANNQSNDRILETLQVVVKGE